VNTTTRLVWQLGITQTVGYASSYYLSAILARPISEDLGFGFENYFAFIAVASIVGGLLGPPLGRLIDKWGPSRLFFLQESEQLLRHTLQPGQARLRSSQVLNKLP
jgi:nitrate/nitrite transporter NarK